MTLSQSISPTRRWTWRGGVEPDDAFVDQAAALATALRLPPLIGTLMLRRAITQADQAALYLEPKLTQMHDPALLPGVPAAADRIERGFECVQGCFARAAFGCL